MYKRVITSDSRKRSFSLTIGLKEGYEIHNYVFAFEDVMEIISDWQRKKVENDLPYLTGTLLKAAILYAWKNELGKGESGNEPVVLYQGEVSPIYHADLSDNEVISLLEDLASVLGTKLSQTRVYITYREEIWILQQQGTTSSRGDKME